VRDVTCCASRDASRVDDHDGQARSAEQRLHRHARNPPEQDRRQPGPETTPEPRSGTPTEPDTESRHEARSAYESDAEKPEAAGARSADDPAQPEFDHGSDRRSRAARREPGRLPRRHHVTPDVTPRRGRGEAPRSAEHRVGDGVGVVVVSPRASAGKRHAVIRDATTQAAEPPDNQMQSKHFVPGRIAHAVGPPRPSARRRGRASGRAGDAGCPPWRILAASPEPCLDPPLPVDSSEQRKVQEAKSRSPAETHERERGGAPAPSREARE
jgi:hypothetical protein